MTRNERGGKAIPRRGWGGGWGPGGERENRAPTGFPREQKFSREPKGRGPAWTEERGTRNEERGTRNEERGTSDTPREPKAAGAAWTHERGTSEEGRRRLKRRPEASGTTERA